MPFALLRLSLRKVEMATNRLACWIGNRGQAFFLFLKIKKKPPPPAFDSRRRRHREVLFYLHIFEVEYMAPVFVFGVQFFMGFMRTRFAFEMVGITFVDQVIVLRLLKLMLFVGCINAARP